MTQNLCSCQKEHHLMTKRIVITGGPGAGKTAVLEMARKNFCQHIAIIPEAASIIFSGGFWRKQSLPGRKAAQRAIYHVQRELEQMVEDEKIASISICDRGTIDTLAYWPDSEATFWSEVRSEKSIEMARYAAVIHLRTPPLHHGYNHENPNRIENAEEAAKIDQLILEAWKDHPHRYIIDSEADFISKTIKVIDMIYNELPVCCQAHKKNNNNGVQS